MARIRRKTRRRRSPFSSPKSKSAPDEGPGLFHQLQIDAPAVQFGEIGVDGTDLGLELHPNRHDDISRKQRGVPERALLGAFALLRFRGAAILARHSAGNRWALQPLPALRR